MKAIKRLGLVIAWIVFVVLFFASCLLQIFYWIVTGRSLVTEFTALYTEHIITIFLDHEKRKK